MISDPLFFIVYLDEPMALGAYFLLRKVETFANILTAAKINQGRVEIPVTRKI